MLKAPHNDTRLLLLSVAIALVVHMVVWGLLGAAMNYTLNAVAGAIEQIHGIKNDAPEIPSGRTAAPGASGSPSLRYSANSTAASSLRFLTARVLRRRLTTSSCATTDALEALMSMPSPLPSKVLLTRFNSRVVKRSDAAIAPQTADEYGDSSKT